MRTRTRNRLIAGVALAGIAGLVATYRVRTAPAGPIIERASPALVFPATGTIRGRVLSRVDGRPVPGAVVRARREAHGVVHAGVERALAATSDAEGNFSLSGLPQRAFQLDAHVAGMSMAEPVTLSVAVQQHIDQVELWLERTFSVSGVLVLRDSPTTPAAGLTVSAVSDRGHEVASARSRTGSDGQFELTGVPQGSYALVVRGESLAQWAAQPLVEINSEGVRDLRLAVPRGVVVRGEVIPPSVTALRLESVVSLEATPPLAAVHMASTTGANGKFEFRGVPPGEFRVIAESANGRSGVATLRSDGGDVAPLSILLEPVGAIAARAVDDAGEPLSAARLLVTSSAAEGSGRPSAGVFKSVQLDGRGVFAVRGLPVGRYDLSLHSAAGLLAWRDPADVREPDAPLSLDVSDPGAVLDLTLSVARCSGTIRGRVSDATGKPVARAWVGAWREAYESARLRSFDAEPQSVALTSATGEFQLVRLCADHYEVRATAESGSFHGQRNGVLVGAAVDLPLRPVATLAGEVIHEAAKVPSYTLALTGPARRRIAVQGDGTYRLQHLLPGIYELIVESDRGYATEVVSVLAGVAEPVRTQLWSWARLRGQLVDVSRRPLVNAKVTLILDRSGTQLLGESVDGAALRVRVGRTDASGRFEFGRLPAGRGKLSFELSSAPLLASNTRVDTLTGAVEGPGRFVQVGLAPGAAADLGSITVRSLD